MSATLEKRIEQLERATPEAGREARIQAAFESGNWRNLSDADLTYAIGEMDRFYGEDYSRRLEAFLESLNDSEINAISEQRYSDLPAPVRETYEAFEAEGAQIRASREQSEQEVEK